MVKARIDAWTSAEDEFLVNTILEYISTGKTQLQAFEQVGKTINRTPAAVGFRWNNVLRHNYKEKIAEAKKKRKSKVTSSKSFNANTSANSQFSTIEHRLSAVESTITQFSTIEHRLSAGDANINPSIQGALIISISKNGKKLFSIKDGCIELDSTKIKMTGSIHIDISDDGSVTIS